MIDLTLAPQLERIVQKMDPTARLVRAEKMQGGISAAMTALEIQHGDGTREKVILRQPGKGTLGVNPNAARDEYKLLKLTRPLGIATPASRFLDESGTILPEPYLVVEYVDGTPDYAPRDPEKFIRQFAAQLAGIHRVRERDADLGFLPRQAKGYPELVRTIAPDAALSFEYARICSVLTAAQALYTPTPFCLVHGDYWQGNVLWHDGTLVAVVDWEDTRVGDPLYDVAISRLDLLTMLGTTAMDRFTEIYRTLAPFDPAALAYWDLNAAIRLARLVGTDLDGWAAFFAPLGRPDITAQGILQQYRAFVTRALAQSL